MSECSTLHEWCADTLHDFRLEMPFSNVECDVLHEFFYDDIDNCTLSELNSMNVDFDLTSMDKYLLNVQQSYDDLLKTLDDRNASNCKIISIDMIPKTSNILELAHLNVRSLIAHHEELVISLELKGYLSIVRLCETWLKPENKVLYNISGYSLYSVSWNTKSDGGVVMLVKNNLKCQMRPDFSNLLIQTIEAVFLEVEGLNGIN